VEEHTIVSRSSKRVTKFGVRTVMAVKMLSESEESKAADAVVSVVAVVRESSRLSTISARTKDGRRLPV
jgi:hypothetical protein